MVIDRRWERLHLNGWRSIVTQNGENWFTGYAQPPTAVKPTPALQHSDFTACRDAAEDNVPPHDCRCPVWREVPAASRARAQATSERQIAQGFGSCDFAGSESLGSSAPSEGASRPVFT